MSQNNKLIYRSAPVIRPGIDRLSVFSFILYLILRFYFDFDNDICISVIVIPFIINLIFLRRFEFYENEVKIIYYLPVLKSKAIDYKDIKEIKYSCPGFDSCRLIFKRVNKSLVQRLFYFINDRFVLSNEKELFDILANSYEKGVWINMKTSGYHLNYIKEEIERRINKPVNIK